MARKLLILASREPIPDRLLDAKYRQSRYGVLESMASAHIYHDGLRWDGSCPDLALLLVPSGGGAPWLEETALMGQERVGVIVLRPDGDVEQLAALIDQLLDVLGEVDAASLQNRSL